MRIYRAVKPLSTGHQAGDIVLETDLKAGVAAVLVKRGALAVASTPPLRELPGWALRSEGMAEVGIETMQEFFEVDEEVIMQVFELRRIETIGQWKREALGWLTAPGQHKDCRGC